MPNNQGTQMYPEALEQAWLRHACRVAGKATARDAVISLEQHAGSLSDAFTTGRDPSFGGYRSSAKALAAYGLFFFPRSFVRTHMVLAECQGWIKPRPGKPFRIADLGAGTGAAGLAALTGISAAQPGTDLHLDMIDAFREGMDLAHLIFAEGKPLWANARLHTSRADASTVRLEKKYNLIICSFAMNEWMEGGSLARPEEWVQRQLDALAPDGLLVLMDPALRTAVDRMGALRDGLAASQAAHVVAPCPHQAPCPMRAGKKYGWCHEVRRWMVPPSMQLINRKLQRDIDLLKFSFLVLAKKAPAGASRDWARLVSPVSREKGKFTCHACGADGKLHHYEWLTRGLNEEQTGKSENLERGDRIAMVEGKLLGDGVTERVERLEAQFATSSISAKGGPASGGQPSRA